MTVIREQIEAIRLDCKRGIYADIEQTEQLAREWLKMYEALEQVRDCPCVCLEDYVRYVDTKTCETLTAIDVEDGD